MFWNLENFFDWKRDSSLDNASEAGFTPSGEKHWTKKKFFTKCDAVSKSIFWIAGKEGRLPDVIGVAEVENSFVLKMLLESTSLDKAGYSFVHFDSPDPRGIDVALLYRKEKMHLVNKLPVSIRSPSRQKDFKTRDILLTQFVLENGDSIAFLVNHHPSKYGGKTQGKRKLAMNRLICVTDSLIESGWKNVVSMGDFNDTPESTEAYSRNMENLAAPLAAKGEGSIKYQGRWEMIDMFFVSEGLSGGRGLLKMKVERIPFLSIRDNSFSGEKPLRTYTGPRYSGGVSDHCPIVLMIP